MSSQGHHPETQQTLFRMSGFRKKSQAAPIGQSKMAKPSQLSVERYIKSISRFYVGALITMSLLIGATYVTMIIALERHSLQQNISFLTSSQFIRFQQLSSEARMIVKAAAEERFRNSLIIDQMTFEIQNSINDIQRMGSELAEMQDALRDNLLERFNARDKVGDAVRADLNRRLSEFLTRSAEIAAEGAGQEPQHPGRAGPIDLPSGADGILMWQFSDLIRIANDRSSISIQNAKLIISGLLLLIMTVLLAASLLFITPLLRNLRREHLKSKLFEEKLSLMAHRDHLTQLFNRSSFNQKLDDLLSLWQNSASGFALLLIDLDQFKQVNDTYGHPAGDAILNHVAKALHQTLSRQAIAARLGGDEFAVLLPGIVDREQMRGIAAQLRIAIGIPCSFEDRWLTISVSIGGASVPAHGTSATTLIRAADLALYSAKAQRDAVVLFEDPEVAARLEHDKLAIAASAAAKNGELLVFYQPMIGLRGLDHRGFEALVRWQHPEFGLLEPGRFLPLLQGPAAMLSLTEAVVNIVAKDICRWRNVGIDPGPISINLPEPAVTSEAGYEIFATALTDHGLDWSDFAIELTEDVMLNGHGPLIAARTERFRAQGVKVALDDFGTGFASLLHLREFPVDCLKIDRSFTSRIGVEVASEQIITAMVALSRDLGKRCVAEGIETLEQQRFLIEAGCDIGQGYLFAEPLPFDKASLRLSGFKRNVASAAA